MTGKRIKTINGKLVDANGNVISSVQNDEGYALNTFLYPYYQMISEGSLTDHVVWAKIGHSASLVANTESDLWAAGGVYVWPTAAGQWEVVSSDNTQDIGTSIRTGTSTGGSTTTLIDTGADFTTGTAVAVGDCILLDKSGTTPEWGYVTSVSATTLGVSGGFSSGGTGSGRAYSILDKSAKTGAQAVRIEYLDGNYATKYEIVVLNGTTAVSTVNTDFFRVNSFRLVAAGTGAKPVGNITLRGVSGGTTYSYIPVGFTRARNSIYTVPAGKTLYIAQVYYGYGYATNQTHFCTFYFRTNSEPGSAFLMDGLFYPQSQAISANASVIAPYTVPLKFLEKTDMKVSAIATYAGTGQSLLRGWLE